MKKFAEFIAEGDNQVERMGAIFALVQTAVKKRTPLYKEISKKQAQVLIDLCTDEYGDYDHGMGFGGEDFGWFYEYPDKVLACIDVAIGRGTGGRSSEVSVGFMSDDGSEHISKGKKK